ncbi:MAG: hypothetical protein A2521_04680 [Deltaproteobacteria bacterium RIFOXYD12_FULL_57_12]|nr:MAG: hypothetical protein A2521_04680 [Deltaproteobacteria bacterium RIFOXYD12_FULL_57_12]
MFDGPELFFLILIYLYFLFLVAYYAEQREKAGRSITSNPYVYSLSLAVYCTSWTFYGSVGKAANSGFSFLTIYLGPTLIASLWGILLMKMIRIAKAQRITTISDFIGSRYGNSLSLSTIVTIVSVIGITPYLGLQIKAIINTFTILTGGSRADGFGMGWIITLILGVFAIIFGARRLDSSERHEGLVFAVALESIVKLVAFLVVGVFVTYGLFDGFADIFARINDSPYRHLLHLGETAQVSYHEWVSLLFLSMMAIMFLPRQFQVAVVENSDENHVKKAMWLFPLYLFLINIFVMPVALGGLLLGGRQLDADSFMLTIPVSQGRPLLALLVFVGGFSAATGMIIVESLALSTMVMNNLVTPGIFRLTRLAWLEKILPTVIINSKRVIILGCVFLGYFFSIVVGEFYTLVDMGLKSFEAVTIFAPSIILGLYWKKGNRNGAIAGIIAGFLVWFYTLIVPALIKAGVLTEQGAIHTLVTSSLLNPQALFGLSGLDRWSHSLFWGLLVNISLYVGLSLFTRKTIHEEKQALMFVDSYSPQIIPGESSLSVAHIQDVLGIYIGKTEAEDVIQQFQKRHQNVAGYVSRNELVRLREEAERVLSGALGTSIAKIILENKLILTEQERLKVSESIRRMAETLRFSRQELAEANRNLAYLKEFNENIIESAPLGIFTIDAELHIKSWNWEMEKITGVTKTGAAEMPASEILPWITQEFLEKGAREIAVESLTHQFFKINISPFTNPAGGYVVIVEDVSETMKMEEQLFQASKLASLGKLTAGISHEIGNPLASISSLVQELTAISPDETDAAAFTAISLSTIHSHINRIVSIVRRLGDFARLSSAEKVPCRIEEILDHTLNLVRYDKRFRNVRLTMELQAMPPLMVNPDRIQQVFLNIILNSLDAMPDGGDLAITMQRIGKEVEIQFRDTGSGIAAEIMNRVFDPFFSTKPLGKGTGLGLSICYGIIQEHHGSIAVSSRKGKGARIVIRLPVVDDRNTAGQNNKYKEDHP